MDDSLHQAIALLIASGQVLEVRAPIDHRLHICDFHHYEEPARPVPALHTDQGVQAIYVSPNELHPALLPPPAHPSR